MSQTFANLMLNQISDLKIASCEYDVKLLVGVNPKNELSGVISSNESLTSGLMCVSSPVSKWFLRFLCLTSFPGLLVREKSPGNEFAIALRW